jgi:nitrite reductase/ring-hydroxylating ferredoxin subunit
MQAAQYEGKTVIMSQTCQSKWHKIATVQQLNDAGRVIAKVGGRQIAVFKTIDGIFAINNRCPHEGYPLIEGTLQGNCTLACNWHGWTFDLKTGQALQGRDAVRTYPVKVKGVAVYVDLAPPDPKAAQKAVQLEFKEAATEHDYERMARALCRHQAAGGRHETLAIQSLNASAEQFERGFGHAHAGLADWIALADDDNDLRLVAFLEGLGHFSRDGVLGKSAPIPKVSIPWDATAFVEAIETMDQSRALQLCNGAFEAGCGFAGLRPLFLRQIFSHYAGFGHPAIYVMKAEQLIAHLGKSVEPLLCLQLTRYLCVAAREDLIPEFKAFPALLNTVSERSGGPLQPAQTLSGMSVAALLPLVDRASSSDLEKWEALLAAAALDMLKFDIFKQDAIAQPIAKNVGWLAFTHAITFAQALHYHASIDASLWRSGHLQQACFVGRNARFLAADQTAKFRVENSIKFLSQQKAALFDMDQGDYIYSVHRLKMVVAVEKLMALVREETSQLLLAALNRYLSSPVRQKHPARTAFQARATVLRE